MTLKIRTVHRPCYLLCTGMPYSAIGLIVFELRITQNGHFDRLCKKRTKIDRILIKQTEKIESRIDRKVSNIGSLNSAPAPHTSNQNCQHLHKCKGILTTTDTPWHQLGARSSCVRHLSNNPLSTTMAQTDAT